MTFIIILQYNKIRKSRFPHLAPVDREGHSAAAAPPFFTMGIYVSLSVSTDVYRCYEYWDLSNKHTTSGGRNFYYDKEKVVT